MNQNHRGNKDVQKQVEDEQQLGKGGKKLGLTIISDDTITI